MKRLCGVVLLIGMQLHAQTGYPPDRAGFAAATEVHAKEVSAAEKEAEAAKLQIQKDPQRFQAHNDLALALVRRAQETSDSAYCAEAGRALQTALKLAPDNFQVLKTQVALLLCSRRFSEARNQAILLNRRAPDDVAVYGYLANADIELGNYSDAETEAQWMLNLLPNNVPGLLIGADLRTLYGDADGALEFLNQAYRETAPTEAEELAGIANRMASIDIETGKIDQAEQAIQQALSLVPGDARTLRHLAGVRLSQRRYADALELLGQLRSVDPHDLYQRAEILERTGDTAQAKRAYAEFERSAGSRQNAPENANRDLIFYYSDHANNPAKALEISQHELSLRHDVFTQDANAWALYASGRYAEASVAMKKALDGGIRNADFFFHAGKIAAKSNDPAAATRDFAASLQVNPGSAHAPEIAKLTGASSPTAMPTGVASSLSGPWKESTSAPIEGAAAVQPGKITGAASNSLPADDPGAETNPTMLTPIPAGLLMPRPTETDRLIRATQAQVARNSKEASGYAKLGAAFFQRARETGDVSYYEQSEQALTKSLEMVSNDFSAVAPTITLAEVCMGEHRFDDALANAEKALSLGSGDLSPYAIVGDAYTDTGDYEKAAVAYSRLLQPDQEGHPGRSYVSDSRMSYLRFLSGDTSGAISLMQRALADGTQARLPSENLAWLYFELGEYYFQAGRTASADASYVRALTIHPGDYRALAGLGRVRALEGRSVEAIELYKRAIAVVPMPIFVAELGDLYAKSGNTVEAKKQYQLVEYIGLLGSINQVLHNRDLALFYADHDMHLQRALELAHKEFEVRRDIYTWDALAWALQKNGKSQQAADAMTNALRLGTKDAILLYHAGIIYQSLGQQAKAKEFLGQALAINPHFHLIYADVARRELAKAEGHPVQLTSRSAAHAQ